jgi:hypothetical protein
VKYLNPQELIDGGYLQEVNRTFFHPLGLALEVKAFSAGTVQPFVISVQDHRDDLEGVVFDETPSREKFEQVYTEKQRRDQPRRKALGYFVQPFEA